MSSTEGHRRLTGWRREAVLAGVFYLAYTATRDVQGSASVSATKALANARHVIGLEQALRVFHEQSIQAVALTVPLGIRFANIFYESTHFVITVGALVWLYNRAPDRYRRARNVLALTTGLALVGFTLFPTMPPRLLPSSYGFIDTVARYPGLWSFHSGPVQQLSNQYAAMPSLHFACAAWVAWALWPAVKDRLTRTMVVAYPCATLVAVVVTGNHFVADVVAGGVTLAAAVALVAIVSSGSIRWRSRPRVSV